MEYLQAVYQLLQKKLQSWFEGFVDMLPNYLLATLIILLFIVLSRIFRKLIFKALQRTSNNEAINDFISMLISIMVVLMGVFVALDVVHLDKTFASILAGAGIMGLAFSLGFQDVVANFVSSFMIATRKPYVAKDLIESNGVFGRVRKINMRSTYIDTPKGQTVVIPNRMIYQNPMTNFSGSGNRRIDLKVSVSYEADLRKVQQITMDAIKQITLLQEGKEIEFFYEAFGDYSIELVVRYWIPFSKQSEYMQAVHEGIVHLKEAFDENGIVIPYPIHTISLESGLEFPMNSAKSKDK
jgi:small conductance mechanosensitive channel